MLLALSCLLSGGCDFAAKPTPLQWQRRLQPPTYRWSRTQSTTTGNKFPVGTEVIRKDQLASSDGATLLHTTLRLESKSEKGITITTQTAIERDGKRQESDPISAEYLPLFDYPREWMRNSSFCPIH